MSSVGIDMLQMYLAPDRCGWLDSAGEGHWEEGESFDDRLERCIAAAARAWPRRSLRRRAVQIWVSGDLIRPFLVGPMAGLKSAEEMLTFARSRVAEATGWDEPCEVRLDGDVSIGTVLATAMPASLHQQIEAHLKTARLRLTSLRPWWAGALEQALQAQPKLVSLIVEEPTSLVLLAGQDGQWSLAEVLAPKPSADELVRTVNRLAAGATLPADSSMWLRWQMHGAKGDDGLLWPASNALDRQAHL